MKGTIILSAITAILNVFAGVLLFAYSGEAGDRLIDFYKNFYAPQDVNAITRTFFKYIDYWWAMLLVIVVLSFQPLVFSKGWYRYMSIAIAVVCLVLIWATPYVELILGNSPTTP